MTAPVISVIIPTHNRAGMLPRLFESLARQDQCPAFEILLVDDCSTDDTPAVVEAWNAAHPERPVRFLRTSKNGGPGQARNAGLEQALGRIAAFTDSDCSVDSQWLSKLTAGLDPENKIAGVGGRVEPIDNGHVYARYSTVNRTLEPQPPANYLVTCNCCYDRAALLEVGAFPPDIPTPGGEDVAASIRLWRKGWRFAFCEEAIVFHDFRAGLKDFAKTYRNYGYGCAAVVYTLLTEEERHPEWGKHDAENYWSGVLVRPNVTGVRSCLRDTRDFFRLCRLQGRPSGDCYSMTFLRAVDRLAFLWGWRQGVRRYAGSVLAEKGDGE